MSDWYFSSKQTAPHMWHACLYNSDPQRCFRGYGYTEEDAWRDLGAWIGKIMAKDRRKKWWKK